MEAESQVPRCVGVIMDGNRRWARAQGRESHEGHTAGYARLKDFLGWARDAGIHTVIAYAFSTENWKRSEAEVGHIMGLLTHFIQQDAEKMFTEAGRQVRVRFLGDRSRFDSVMRAAMESLEQKTAHVTDYAIGIALSYGGRAEILHAVRAARAVPESELTEESFSSLLWTAGMPDPDLIIRTGGEQRLSNFLPWQSVYSELFFTPTQWPAFSETEFKEILAAYSARKRNFGV